jgi:hypothetical protein
MNPDKFDDYVKNRYRQQIEWYDWKALSNQGWYTKLQWALLIFSALTPVLVGVELHSSSQGIFQWAPLVTGLLVTVLASVLKIFKFQENWVNYRTTCETLKKEIYLYDAGVGEYATTADKEATFVERVEALISRENTLWLTTAKLKSESKDVTS